MFQSMFVFLISSGLALLTFTGQTSISPIIPELMYDFSINHVEITIISSSFFYTYLFLQVPGGVLVDKYGARNILIISSILIFISILLFILSQNYWQALVSRMCLGIAGAPAVSCALYIAARWFSPYMFALATGIMEAVVIIGAGLGQVVLSYAINYNLGWRGGLLIFSIAALILLILSYKFVFDSPNISAQSSEAEKTSGYSFKFLLQRNVWLNGIFTGLMFAVISGFASFWLIPFLSEVYSDAERTTISLISMFAFLGAAVGAPIIGFICGKTNQRKLVMAIGASICLFFSIIGIYFPPVAIYSMMMVLFVIGFSCGVYIIPFIIIKESVNESSYGTAMGFTNTMSIVIGAPILQPVIASLLYYFSDTIDSVNAFGVASYQFSLSVIPICIVLAIVLVFFMDNDKLSD